MRKIAVSLATLLLASPACAQGWYPGFTGTYTGGGGGGGTTTYPDDVATANNMTPVASFGYRAKSAAAAASGANLFQLIGDGATGDAATTVSTIVTANSDGSPNLTAAYAAGGACSGGDGTCLVYLKYDQSGNGNVATAAAKSATYAERFYKNCPSTASNVSATKACGYCANTSSPAVTCQYKITWATVPAQPFVYNIVAARLPSSAGAYGNQMMISSTSSAAPNLFYGSQNYIAANGGTTVSSNSASYEGPFNAITDLYNGASSGLTINGSASAGAFISGTTSQGTTVPAATTYYLSSNGSAPFYGYELEAGIYQATSSTTAANLYPLNKNQSTYWGLGF